MTSFAQPAGQPPQSLIPGWTLVAEQPLLLVREYSFGAGLANSLAVRLGDGSFMLVSPPGRAHDDEVAAFRAHGGVSVLLTNNGTHHLGLGPWQKLFPEAQTYASPRAASRIRKKGKDAGELRDPAAIGPRLGDRIALLSVEGDKVGDVLVRIRSNAGIVLYTSDFVANFKKLPPNPVAGLLFKLTNSAPGLKVFNLFFAFFVADRKAARASLIRELTEHPPAVVVPAHGEVAREPELGPRLVKLLAG